MDEPTRLILARNLRAARQAKGLTQAELGTLTGLTRSDVSEIERADPSVNPGSDRLCRLANALDLTMAALFTN